MTSSCVECIISVMPMLSSESIEGVLCLDLSLLDLDPLDLCEIRDRRVEKLLSIFDVDGLERGGTWSLHISPSRRGEKS
jgi:hypothetical protein